MADFTPLRRCARQTGDMNLHKVYSTLHMVRRNELDWSPTICQNHWLIQRKQKKKLKYALASLEEANEEKC
ncbi:hypothetical protein T4D_12698 [Trichinella pseudospiralis]|uniref:Uncharacterized protein n=1 Tax=Trichinella pseudospiralis TaxID=6337 RepID=A0A0V1FLU5_TRIPS|nr:hypothetical protein T4D_12698 [Trichinella pseudospiralis]